MKHIVAVIFEDGTKATLDDMQTLVHYVAGFRMQRNLRTIAADTDVDWVAHAKAVHQRNNARLEKQTTILANRRKPRGKAKDLTPEEALRTLEEIIAREGGQKWGSSKKAAKELKISPRKLNRLVKKKSAP